MCNFKKILYEICRSRAWFFCRFLDYDSPMLHKYLVLVAETCQYLDEMLEECLEDRDCLHEMAVMVHELLGVIEYYPSIDCSKLTMILRRSFRKYV